MDANRIPFMRLAKYTIVGGLNTLIAFAVFVLFLRLGVHFAVATLLGGLTGVVVGFRLHGRLVFEHSGQGRFLRFVLIFALTYVLSLAIQTEARKRFNGYLSGAIAACVTVPASFFLNRNFVFRGKSSGSME